MKKTLLILLVVSGIFIAQAQAQAQPRGIGLRVGPNMELSFQQGLKNNSNMLEIDAGFFYFQGVFLNVTYNWLSSVESSSSSGGTWTSYGGFGAGGGYSFDSNSWYSKNKGLNYLTNFATIGIAGLVGIEYKFENAPIAVALDYRPLFGIDMGNHAISNKFKVQYHLPGLWNFGLSAHFTF